MSKTKRGGYLAALALAAGTAVGSPAPAWAQSVKMPEESGFSGYLSLLGGYFSAKSQFLTDGDNRQTSSLNSSGQTINSAVIAPLFEVGYTVKQWRTQFYGGLPAENLREGTFFQEELGVRHWLADGTRLSVALLPWPVVPGKTWQDPFVTDEGRKRSDIDSLGVKLQADQIAGTDFGVRYRFIHRDIDKEDSGQSLRDAGVLTGGDVDNLRRSNDTHEVTGSYLASLGQGFFLRPALRYTFSDADGGSNSYQGLRPEIGVLYGNQTFDTSINLLYQRAWFDKDNPIYNEKRDSNDYGAVFLFGYKRPFGLEKLRADFVASATFSDSEINFYDTRAMFVGAGATYTF